jgi:hypothetical protein
MSGAPGGSAGSGHGSDPDEDALLRRIREFLRHGTALADELQRKLEQVRATENGEYVEEAAPARPSRRRRERVAV